MAKIVLIEPFFTGSHRKWCEGLQKHSSHEMEVVSLPGNHWKWRMHGAAVQLSSLVPEKVDLLVVSDFLDLATFKSLHQGKKVPCAIYFHENQITYPWSQSDRDLALKRDNHYGWINFTSALVADVCLFNSEYHKRSFLGALPRFLEQFPDGDFKQEIQAITAKSKVLHLGCELTFNQVVKTKSETPILLWNHRWEYDKNPEDFLKTLEAISDLDWQLMLLGESFKNSPGTFQVIQDTYKERIVHSGFAESQEYQKLLAKAHILPVTSNQDFFGGSVVEAIAAGVYPILPNRLAYPEHVGEDELYHNFDDLVRKLRRSIERFDQLPSLSKNVEKYRWENCISKYDSTFQEIIDSTFGVS